MSLAMKEFTIHFDPTSGQRQEESQTVVLDGTVRKAQAALKGFKVGYSDRDHHFLETEIVLDVTRIFRNSVTVTANFLLQDSTGGDMDDPFDGCVQGIVIADVA